MPTGADRRWRGRLRGGARGVPTALLVFCAANLLWSLIGGWTLRFVGKQVDYIDTASWSSYVRSENGRLTLALRDSPSYGRSGIYPADWQSRRSVVTWDPPSLYAHVSPFARQMFQRSPFGPQPARLLPGITAIWDRQPAGEFYNRIVDIHWAWPTALAAIAPAIALRRRSRRRRAGECSQCGYDLRATPERCPECGVPARDSR